MLRIQNYNLQPFLKESDQICAPATSIKYSVYRILPTLKIEKLTDSLDICKLNSYFFRTTQIFVVLYNNIIIKMIERYALESEIEKKIRLSRD